MGFTTLIANEDVNRTYEQSFNVVALEANDEKFYSIGNPNVTYDSGKGQMQQARWKSKATRSRVITAK